MTAGTALDTLKLRRPEWEPWLAVIEEVLRETRTRTWEAAVPAGAPIERGVVPLLADTTVSVQVNSVRGLLERLIRIASVHGTPKMATLRAALDADLDVLTLFSASLHQDTDPVNQAAASSGADMEALQAVVLLVAVPFLHACNRRWASSISESWVERYCPVCGSWPAFAEVCGIERSRYFRCGRCAGRWHAHMLTCPYCATSDHKELVALVPEKGGPNAAIDACTRCRGYVKTFTRLQGCPPDAVMLEDLASVDLDVAALEQGYTRPSGTGYHLRVTVIDSRPVRRFFGWNANRFLIFDF
jgi:FdhE protein